MVQPQSWSYISRQTQNSQNGPGQALGNPLGLCQQKLRSRRGCLDPAWSRVEPPPAPARLLTVNHPPLCYTETSSAAYPQRGAVLDAAKPLHDSQAE